MKLNIKSLLQVIVMAFTLAFLAAIAGAALGLLLY